MTRTAPTLDVGFRSERGPVLIALMLTTGMVAIDATILATAVPTITKEIGGFSSFPWLFSIYLLAQAVTVPVYAKLADMIGRKPIMLIGIGLFLLGSVLCGFAWSMPALIAFRALQGIGAGAVQPMSITIAGDIYTVAERAKAQAYIASVWAIASVVGPTLGGLFSQYLSWRWIFFVNVPISVFAIVLIVRVFHEKVERRAHKVDYAGAVTLTVALSLIILAVLEGGQAWAWDSWQSIAAFTLGGLLLVTFVLIERHATEPVLPLWVFSRRLLLSTSLISLGIGALVIGLTSYVPNYLENSVGATPLVAGLALAALTIGWPIAASQAGRLYLRIGFRNTVFIGMSLATLGTLALVLTASHPSVITVAAICIVIGAGMGLSVSPSLIAAQSSVQWNERGVVTGTNLFSRSIGSAVGIAIFGAVANSVFAAHGGNEHDIPTVITASTTVFVGGLVAAVFTVAAALFMPKTTTIAVAEPSAAAEPTVG